MSSTSKANDIDEDDVKTDSAAHDPHTLDIRGFAMLPTAQALWAHYDDQVDPAWIQRRQLTHVMLLSFMSFSGRLLSGIGSDLIVKKLGMSRFWCLFISSAIFCIAQVCGAKIENPNYLFFVSGTTGLAYGFLFGVYPSLVAETFGVHGLSQNWGWMTLAPVISGNIFNLLYGRIYDSHSNIDHDGHRQCLQGIRCYRTAYWVTFGASLAGVLVALWSIRWNNWREKNGLAFTSIRGKKKIVEREA
ncbi:hypothetical protein MMC25_002967 [Agyrium rufum]|nr:hypothetical protein [Agyrium rufum]